MKEEVIDTLNDAQKKLLNANRWTIGYLAKIEDVFINLAFPEYTYTYMLKFVDGLLKNDCIDEVDYSLLKHLIEIVETNRVNYEKEISYNNSFEHWQQAKNKRIYMRDYLMKSNEIIFIEEYKEHFIETNEIIPVEYKLYSMKNNEIIPVEEYDKRLKKVYDEVMTY